ncbi:MAG: LysM peptidoglycan-binding domain-containing protein [Anaerolineae bacterium]|nr:LysM peptidoglycan-binding domain-containing protein [Anaerolineae bacterium]
MSLKFEPAPMSRRDLILVIASGVIALGVIIVLVVILVRAGREPQGPAATEAAGITPTAVASTAAAPTVSPSPSGPPTETPPPAPTPTLEPYQYTVKAEDTLFFIIQLFGYRDLAVVPEIIRINGMANENDLRVDQVLLIPRQTPTPGPTPTPTLEGSEATAGPTMDYTGCSFDNKCTSSDGQYWVHVVQEGDTIASIAYRYVSRVDAIEEANGYPDFIVPGQEIYVPILVTLTPTLTPTGGPDSTATPTPTLSPPSLLGPADGETISRGDTVILQWVAVHPLEANQYYLVVVRNLGTEEEHRATTRSNSYRLPSGLRPGVGQSGQFEWQVVIVNGNNTQAAAISGLGPTWAFTWGS